MYTPGIPLDDREEWEKWEAKLKLSPNNPSFHNSLGLAYAKVGRFDEALQHVEEALRLDRKNVSYLYSVGKALEDVERLEEAAEHYKAVLSMGFDFPGARGSLVVLLEKMGRYKEASQYSANEGTFGRTERPWSLEREQLDDGYEPG